MLNHINLPDIRSFVLIAQLGNFTKAAEALAVSRSHVSRQVSNLEQKMGVTLFIRTTRTLRLTESGQNFYIQCEEALNRIDQALLAAVDDTEKVQGSIRINCVGGYLGEEIIAPMVCRFIQQYPDIDVSLDFSSHRVDLIEDAFDVAFRMGNLEDSGFIAKKLMDIEMGTLASNDYLKQHGRPSHPRELNQHHCLVGSVTKWRFESKSSLQIQDNSQTKDHQRPHADVQINGQLQCKNGRVLVQGAMAGIGIIRVPRIYCRPQLEAGELEEVFEEWVIPSVPFSAIYHKDKYQPRRLRTFVDFMKQAFEQIRS